MSFDLDRTSREVLEHATGSRETLTPRRSGRRTLAVRRSTRGRRVSGGGWAREADTVLHDPATRGLQPHRPRQRVLMHLEKGQKGSSLGPMRTSASRNLWDLRGHGLGLADLLRVQPGCSSMFWKSMSPPKFSWQVRSSCYTTVLEQLGQDALGEVALTWLLMSSPTIGRPAAANFAAHLGSEAMKTGRALTKATRRGPR
jgi:hypothetical protein